MLDGEDAQKPLVNKRYQSHLLIGTNTRFVWFDFKDKSTRIDAWGKNTSFIGIFKEETFLHLITECCLSPVKINRGNKKKDDTGPEWHYCLAQKRWMFPYETVFVRYKDLIENWGTETLSSHHDDFFFHNLGAVLDRGVAPIVTNREHWKGRTLNYPRGMVVKPDDDSPFVMKGGVQVFPGDEEKAEKFGGMSSIKEKTTLAESTKEQA